MEVGRLLVRVADAQGRTLPPGEIGEVLVCGGTAMVGRRGGAVGGWRARAPPVDTTSSMVYRMTRVSLTR